MKTVALVLPHVSTGKNKKKQKLEVDDFIAGNT
jgi:hypothetical protein